MSKKNWFYTILIVIFSIICGVITKDYFAGTVVLMCGLLNAYYASIGKVVNYVFGGLYSCFVAYVSYINGLYGLASFSVFVYVPSQIYGYISWKKSMKKNNNTTGEVNVRGFTLKFSLMLTFFVVTLSFIFGYLLNLIPSQNLAFLDSSSNIINLCAVVLMNYRYKECWMIWLVNNTIDLIIWIVNTVKGTPNSTMMLLVSIGFLSINVYGLYKWIKMEHKSDGVIGV